MAEVKSIRLNKVLKEFNISLDRAVDFLKSKSIEIEARPTAKISDTEYKLLSEGFAKDKEKKVESKEVGEEKRKEKEELFNDREREREEQEKRKAEADAAAKLAAEKAAAENDNYITIKSPIIGTFYRKPSPDKPMFAEVGQQISEGDVLCVIEAMKLFNEIESEVSGKIVKILVDDSSPVEFEQPLFLIDPS